MWRLPWWRLFERQFYSCMHAPKQKHKFLPISYMLSSSYGVFVCSGWVLFEFSEVEAAPMFSSGLSVELWKTLSWFSRWNRTQKYTVSISFKKSLKNIRKVNKWMFLNILTFKKRHNRQNFLRISKRNTHNILIVSPEL